MMERGECSASVGLCLLAEGDSESLAGFGFWRLPDRHLPLVELHSRERRGARHPLPEERNLKAIDSFAVFAHQYLGFGQVFGHTTRFRRWLEQCASHLFD